MNLTKEEKLNILEQMIDDGEVDPMETIRSLSASNDKLLEACKVLLACSDNNLCIHCKDAIQQAIREVESEG